jgi:predicted O-methyltransferase YrrM
MPYVFRLPVGSRHLRVEVSLTSTPPTLPLVDLEAVAPGEPTPRMLEPDAADGNISFNELYVVNCIVRSRAPCQLFEFGTFDGRTILNMAANSPEVQGAYSLDLPRALLDRTAFAVNRSERRYIDKPAVGGRLFDPRYAALRERIHLLEGDSATFDFTPYVGHMDLVFVDASHEYDYVLGDSRRALTLIAGSGGIVLWHDYGVWNGVTRALDELRASHQAFAGLSHIRGTSLVILTIDGR